MSAVYAGEFGPLVVETDVDFAVIRTLRLWLPTYLTRIEQDRNLALRTLARPEPQAYVNTLDDTDDEFRSTIFPAIVVTTAQLDEEPVIAGDGTYSGGWRVVVTAIVRASTPSEGRALASLFGGSVRRCLLNQQDLGGFASEIRLRSGARVASVATSTGQDRYLTASINPFQVYVDAIVQAGVGPYVPDPGDPYPYDPPDPTDPDTPYDPLVPLNTVTVEVNAKEE